MEIIQFNYVYFLYTIEKNKNWEITCEHPIKILSTFNKINDENIAFNINLYEIIIDKNKFANKKDKSKIEIKLANENDNKYSYVYLFETSSFYHDIYLYDIDFTNQNKLSPPLQYNLTLDEKYEIFSGKNKGINYGKYMVDERKMESLITHTQENLKKIDNNFSLYILIFNDIINLYSLDFLFNDYIKAFDINIIIFDDKKIYHNLDIKKLFSFLDTKKFENNKLNQNLELFHDLLLIWLYKQEKDFIELNYYNKIINKRIFKILLNKKSSIYSKVLWDLKISINIINDFIEIADNYKDLLIILSYDNNFLEIIEVINKNFKIISKILRKEKERQEKIKFGDFIKPNKHDDLNIIKIQLEKLFILEKKSDINLVEISPQLIKTYFNFYRNNPNELIIFLQIANLIFINKFFYQYCNDYKSIIYDISQELEYYAYEGKLTNMNLLKFIKTQNENILNRKLLSNINLDKIDNEFIKTFKEINWEKIFMITKEDLIIKICELIRDVKNLGQIFLLFDFNKEINQAQMNIVKDRFFNLLEIYNEKENTNLIECCSKLIYFLNTKNCDLKSFFEKFFEHLYNIADQVFCKIFHDFEYNKLNDDLKNIIHDFYYNPKNKDLDKSIYLIYEIENNKNFDPVYLKSYYINYMNFFDLKKSHIFSFLEKIISKNMLDYECLNEFIEYNLDEANEIIDKIKEGKVQYKIIKIFFKNNNDKNEFKRRIEIISKFLKEYEENKNLFNDIEEKINNINKIVDNLNTIKQKMNKYLKKSRKEDINEIKDLITEIESNNLSYYLNNKEQIQKFMKMEDIEKLPLNFKKTNFFFKILYDEANSNNEDEIEILNETFINLRNFIQLLNSNPFTNESIIYINKIMNEINEEQYGNLDNEIENLKSFINAKFEEKNELIISKLKLIWKKDLIYNFSIIFKLIIGKKYFKKTEFTAVNNLIYKYLELPNNINIISVCYEFFKNYKIELNEDIYFDFYKSIKLVRNMEEIIHYLINIDIQMVIIKFNEYDDNEDNYIKDALEKLINFKIFIESILSNSKGHTKDLDIIKTFINELNDSNEYKKDLVSIFHNFNLIKENIQMTTI